jgi:hypothetical protein
MRDQPVVEASTYTGQHKTQTSMPSVGFEPAIPATKQSQTYALGCAATRIGKNTTAVALIVQKLLYGDNNSGAQPVTYIVVTCFLSLGIRQLGSEANYSSLSSTEVQNAWSYTSTCT